MRSGGIDRLGMADCSSKRWTYDVFLSFRGEDTRTNFTDHLHAALVRKGITTFRDDRKLEVGGKIAPQLMKAIEDSRFVVVVFSKNYAASSWCLDELAEIRDCLKAAEGHTVIPVFYDIDPSDVRHQKGCFEEAFQVFRERGVEPERLQRWRVALNEVANLAGWHLGDCHEAEFMEAIAERISSKLWCAFSGIASELVGIETRAGIVANLLDVTSHGIRSVGILGMGGIGKSTIARVVYEKMLHLFDAGSFLASVGQISKKNGGIVTLQEQLLSDTLCQENVKVFNTYNGVQRIRSQLGSRKLLLVLDSVDEYEQLENLAGDLNWFGSGSRIIITTRDMHLLRKVHCIYEVSLLSKDEALSLFRLNAFGRGQAISVDYELLSKEVVGYCSGLPLALKVLGCFLVGKTAIEWRSAIDKLNDIPNKKIFHTLKISYNGLDETAKWVFLCIACCFVGCNEEVVKFLLKCMDLHPDIEMRILKDRSLLNVSEGIILMHDLLQELGRHIIHQECPAEPAKRSILWSFSDIQNALNGSVGSGSTEVLVLNSPVQGQQPMQLDLHGLSKFDKLKLLAIAEGYEFFGKLEALSNEMRAIVLKGCPLKSLPSNFQPCDLRLLALHSSSIARLWDDSKCFEKLQEISLRDSKNLVRSPDLSNLPNLRLLCLEGCVKLVEVRSSRPLHKRLTRLNLKGCTRLRHLPEAIHFPSLEWFILSGCLSLPRFPEISGCMEHLTELHLDGTAISELPASINFLAGLVRLSACNCPLLSTLPSTICDLEHLKFLDLSGCVSLCALPKHLEKLNLERLEMTGCGQVGRGTRGEEFNSTWRLTRTYTARKLAVLWITLNIFQYVFGENRRRILLFFCHFLIFLVFSASFVRLMKLRGLHDGSLINRMLSKKF